MKTITWERFVRSYDSYVNQDFYRRGDIIVAIGGNEHSMINIIDKGTMFWEFIALLEFPPKVETPKGYLVRPLTPERYVVKHKNRSRSRSAATKRKAGKALVNLMSRPNYNK